MPESISSAPGAQKISLDSQKAAELLARIQKENKDFANVPEKFVKPVLEAANTETAPEPKKSYLEKGKERREAFGKKITQAKDSVKNWFSKMTNYGFALPDMAKDALTRPPSKMEDTQILNVEKNQEKAKLVSEKPEIATAVEVVKRDPAPEKIKAVKESLMDKVKRWLNFGNKAAAAAEGKQKNLSEDAQRKMNMMKYEALGRKEGALKEELQKIVAEKIKLQEMLFANQSVAA